MDVLLLACGEDPLLPFANPQVLDYYRRLGIVAQPSRPCAELLVFCSRPLEPDGESFLHVRGIPARAPHRFPLLAHT